MFEVVSPPGGVFCFVGVDGGFEGFLGLLEEGVLFFSADVDVAGVFAYGGGHGCFLRLAGWWLVVLLSVGVDVGVAVVELCEAVVPDPVLDESSAALVVLHEATAFAEVGED